MSMSDEALAYLRASGIFPGPVTRGPLELWKDEPEPSPEPDVCWLPRAGE